MLVYFSQFLYGKTERHNIWYVWYLDLGLATYVMTSASAELGMAWDPSR